MLYAACTVLLYILLYAFIGSLLLIVWEVWETVVGRFKGKPRPQGALLKKVYLSGGILVLAFTCLGLFADQAEVGKVYLKEGSAGVEHAVALMKARNESLARYEEAQDLAAKKAKEEERQAKRAKLLAEEEAKAKQKQQEKRLAQFKDEAEKLVAFCQWAVMQKAKYPSKASTGWHGYEIHYQQPGGKYWNYMNPKVTAFSDLKTRISGTIEFMNGFGALIPHKYQCDFKGDKIEAIRLAEGG